MQDPEEPGKLISTTQQPGSLEENECAHRGQRILTLKNIYRLYNTNLVLLRWHEKEFTFTLPAFF